MTLSGFVKTVKQDLFYEILYPQNKNVLFVDVFNGIIYLLSDFSTNTSSIFKEQNPISYYKI